jgi:hypothetical protein
MADTRRIANIIPDRFKDAAEVARGKFVEWTTPGQVLTGIFLRLKAVPSSKDKGKTFHILELASDDGELLAVSAGTILADQMQQVPIGSDVCIEFVEKLPGSGAYNFRVRHIPPRK